MKSVPPHGVSELASGLPLGGTRFLASEATRDARRAPRAAPGGVAGSRRVGAEAVSACAAGPNGVFLNIKNEIVKILLHASSPQTAEFQLCKLQKTIATGGTSFYWGVHFLGSR